jgi:hypothetical protein
LSIAPFVAVADVEDEVDENSDGELVGEITGYLPF